MSCVRPAAGSAIVGLVFASLWAFTIFMNTVVARWFGEMAFMRELWPFPGHLVAAIGIVSSLAMTVLARRLSGKPILLDVGSGYLVLQCLLVSILSQWAPVPITPRVSWVCIPILFYPAIVPNTPKKTLVTSLLAASTEPLRALPPQSASRGPGPPQHASICSGTFCPTTSVPSWSSSR